MAIWGSNGNFVETPPDAFIEQGFNPQQPLVARYLNWILNACSTFLNTTFLVEHNADGTHDDVTATSLTSESYVAADGDAGFQYGAPDMEVVIQTGFNMGRVWVTTDTSVLADNPVSSMRAGAYMQLQVNAAVGDPVLTIDMPVIDQGSLGGDGGRIYQITAVEFGQFDLDADWDPFNVDGEIMAELISIDTDGTETVIWDRDLIEGGSDPAAGTWGDALTGLALNITKYETVVMRVECTNNAGPAIRFPANVTVYATKSKVE